jgi:hypothetical protein
MEKTAGYKVGRVGEGGACAGSGLVGEDVVVVVGAVGLDERIASSQ